MTVVGSKRMAVYDDIDPLEKIKVYDRGIDVPPYTDSFGEFQLSYRYGDTYSPRLVETEPLKAECRASSSASPRQDAEDRRPQRVARGPGDRSGLAVAIRQQPEGGAEPVRSVDLPSVMATATAMVTATATATETAMAVATATATETMQWSSRLAGRWRSARRWFRETGACEPQGVRHARIKRLWRGSGRRAAGRGPTRQRRLRPSHGDRRQRPASAAARGFGRSPTCCPARRSAATATSATTPSSKAGRSSATTSRSRTSVCVWEGVLLEDDVFVGPERGVHQRPLSPLAANARGPPALCRQGQLARANGRPAGLLDRRGRDDRGRRDARPLQPRSPRARS